VLGVANSFDYETVVPGKVEERTRFSRRAEFRQNVFGGEREKIVGGVEMKVLAQGAKDPRSIVLEFKVVLCGWREFVSDTKKPMKPIKNNYTLKKKKNETNMSKENLCRAV
jgi:hypothetical protein